MIVVIVIMGVMHGSPAQLRFKSASMLSFSRIPSVSDDRLSNWSNHTCCEDDSLPPISSLFSLVGRRLPIHIHDLVVGPQVFLGIAMAV